MKPSVAQRVEQFQRFYARENERPLLGFWAGSEYPLHRYRASQSLPEDRPLTPDDFPVDRYLEDFDRLFAEHEALGGDFIFSACAFWGIPWMEALLGCPLTANQATGAIEAGRLPEYGGPGAIPAFDPDSPWACKAAEFLDAAARHAAGRYPLATTRMRGVADLLGNLYGNDGFPLAMMTEPDAVREACDRLTELFIAFGKHQLAHIPAWHGGIGSFYYYLWAPAGTVWHQEDAAAMLSPDLYREFVRPCDERIIAAFDGCIMHTHSTGYVPVDDYAAMGFTAVEHHIDAAGPSAESLYDRHRALQAAGPLIIWGDIPEADLEWLFTKLPPQGLAIITCVDGPEHAEALWKRYGP